MRSLNRDLYGDLPGRVKLAYEELCARQTEAMQNPQASNFEDASDAWEHWHHISGIEEKFFYQNLEYSGWVLVIGTPDFFSQGHAET